MRLHIQKAHQFWKEILRSGDTVIDATCGNGHDTLFLANLLSNEGRLYAYDIQKGALEQTKKRLAYAPNRVKVPVELLHESHAFFFQKKARLVVYNLGYLPGGDKSVTTRKETTLESVKNALEIAEYISITCYPGHPEGAEEEKALLQFLSVPPVIEWAACYHKWLYHPKAPSLLWLSRLNLLPTNPENSAEIIT